MPEPSWRTSSEQIARLVAARHSDPFGLLGLQEAGGDFVIRAFVPGAESLTALTRDGAVIGKLTRRHADGFFEGKPAKLKSRMPYRLRAENSGGAWEFEDPYAFGPVLGQTDDYLLVEGTHRQLYEKLGAHPMVHEDSTGTHFAVWAPNAQRVSVVGDFNRWDGRCHQMRKRVDSGLWEIFAPGVGEGTVYKYEIVGSGGQLLPLKADPFGFGAEMRPSTASIVTRTDNFAWGDAPF